MTKVDLVNMALDILEMEPIASLTTDSIGRKVNRWYGPASRYVLTFHPWQEAVYWETLEAEVTVQYTSHATNNTSGLGTFEVQETVATNTPQKGTLTLTINSVEYEREYTSWTGLVFTLSGTLPATADGSDTADLTPNNWNDKFEYMYSLPSTCLEFLDIRGDADYEYRVEETYLYTNEYDSTYGFPVRFIKDISAESSGAMLFSDSVAECIAARLAYSIAPPARKAELRAVLEDALQDAVYEDGEEEKYEGGNGEPFVTETS